MVPMSVEEIAKAVDGRLIGDAGSESRATNTVSDSRQAGPDRCLWPSEASVSMGMTCGENAGQGARCIVDHEVKSDGFRRL